MKKALVVMLAVMMLFAFSATAFAAPAYPDISDQDMDTQNAISFLTALGVFEGDENGNFRPGEAITRAEFAKVACVVNGMGDMGDSLKGVASQFTDVAANQWYTGWINLAVSQNLMKGNTDGTFRPNATITEAEAITVMLRLMGYNDNLPGPWPVDYIAKAGALGMTEGVAFNANAPATRGIICLLLDNALEETTVAWSKDTEEFISRTYQFNGESVELPLLVDKFGNSLGYVVFDADGDEIETSAFSYNNFTKGSVILNYAMSSNAPKKLAKEYGISDNLNLTELAGLGAYVYFDAQEDEKEVKYIKVMDMEYVDDDENVTLGGSRYEYAAKGDVKDFSKGKRIKVNGTVYGTDLDDYDTNANFVKVIFDDDDMVVAIYNADVLDAPSKFGIVETVNASSQKINFLTGGNVSLKDKDVAVIKDGEFVKFEDIKANDVVTVYNDASNIDAVIIVDSLVEGTLDAYMSNDKIKVSGKNYLQSKGGAQYSTDKGDNWNDANAGDLEDCYENEATIALTRAGAIGYMLLSDGNYTKIWGVVVDGSISGLSEKMTEITLFTQNGETVTYKIDNSDGTIFKWEENAYYGSLVKVRVNEDGKIDELVSEAEADTTTGSWSEDETNFDRDNNRIKFDGTSWLTVADNVPIFNVTYNNDDPTDIDEVELVKVSDFFGKKSINDIEWAQYNKNANNEAKAIAMLDLSGTSDDLFGIVKDAYVGKSNYATFFGFDADNFTLKVKDAAYNDVKGSKKALVKYVMSGEKISEVTKLFYVKPTKSGATGDITMGSAADFGATDEINVNIIGYDENSPAVADNGLAITKATSKYITVDDTQYVINKDTQIYNYNDGEDPVKLTAGELDDTMRVIIVTSDDDDLTDYETVAKFIFVIGEVTEEEVVE